MKLTEYAQQYASELHKDQLYGEQPYSDHLNLVAIYTQAICEKAELDDNTKEVAICTAWLHDCVEDGHTEIEDICDKFNMDIARCVSLLTKDIDLFNLDKYLKEIKESPIARIVKTADVMSNLAVSVVEMNIQRVSKYTQMLNILVGEDE